MKKYRLCPKKQYPLYESEAEFLTRFDNGYADRFDPSVLNSERVDDLFRNSGYGAYVPAAVCG